MFTISITCTCGTTNTWQDEAARTAVFCNGCDAHLGVTIVGAQS